MHISKIILARLFATVDSRT